MTDGIPDIVPRYSAKAAAYQQFRWRFAAEAVAALLEATGLSTGAAVADIGAGTGLSSEPFLKLGCDVYAVEPNTEMRTVAQDAYGAWSNLRIVAGRGEQTGLPDGFADLISAGRALHWLPQDAARWEFSRICKREGWLAIMAVKCLDEEYLAAVQAICTAENGWDAQASKNSRRREPFEYFFEAGVYGEITSPRIVHESWTQFLGRILTMAPAPAEQDPAYQRFVTKLRELFDQRQQDGQLVLPVATRILYGRPARLGV